MSIYEQSYNNFVDKEKIKEDLHNKVLESFQDSGEDISDSISADNSSYQPLTESVIEPIENFEDDNEDLEHQSDDCLDGDCEGFENNESTENKDMELWTCYPSKKENFENSEESNSSYDSIKKFTKNLVLSEDKNMNKIYMYWALFILILFI
jgi:hypothetical protein